MTIFNGQDFANNILAGLAKKTAALAKQPFLLVLTAREDKKGQAYTSLIQKQAKTIGVKVDARLFSLKTKRLKIEPLSYSAVLIQKPGQVLRRQYFSSSREFEIWWLTNTSQIPEKKDIDCLNVANLGLLTAGLIQFYPASVKAIWRILAYALGKNMASAISSVGVKTANTARAKQQVDYFLSNKQVVILGASAIVGKPLAMLLRQHGATVTIVSEKCDPKQYTTMSDIVISAVGKPHLVTAKMIKKGSVVIDAGFSYKNNRVVGDVDFDSAKLKASFITPVPGGVGPVTTACLLENVYLAAVKQAVNKSYSQKLNLPKNGAQ